MRSLKEALISKSNRDWAMPSNNANYLLLPLGGALILYSEFRDKEVDCAKWGVFLLSEKDLVGYYKMPLNDIFELEYSESVVWKTHLELKDVDKLFKKIGDYEFDPLVRTLDNNKNFSRI
jgi:hypothetical protein